MIAVKKKISDDSKSDDSYIQDDFIDRFFQNEEVQQEGTASSKLVIEEESYAGIKPTRKRPEPLDLEIELDPKKYILSKTDVKGIIEYGNEYFVEISGYTEEELIGQPHNLIRHPDMPKIVFKLLWDRIKSKQDITAVVKNLAKDGRYYWVMTEFEIKEDPLTGEPTGYFAYRRSAPKDAVEVIEPLYKKLVDIEKVSGMAGSEKYLMALLETKHLTYDDFINDITGKNKGFMKLWFKAMKKFFS